LASYPKSPVNHAVNTVSLGFFHLKNLAASIVPAVGADSMRQDLVAAVGAAHQVWRADGIVGAAAIAATLADFSFW
jgi:hypothetical protein